MKRLRFDYNALIALVGIVLAGLLRLRLRGFSSADFVNFTESWYGVVKAQGWSAFRTSFYNYCTPAYIYALYLVSRVLPRIYPVFATKIPSIAADFICAGYAYRIVRLRYGRESPAPVFAALAILFAPTVVLNSAAWGQQDMLFTAPLVACLYYLLWRQETAAWLAFGIALTVKLQAVFLAPFLLLLLLRRELSWKKVLLVPLVYFVSVVPAWLTGRPLYELLTIYLAQAGLYKKLTLNAPTLYAWLPQGQFEIFFPAGMLFGAGICFLLVAVAARSRAPLTPPLLVGLALASALVTPYVLPDMHERYFFVADVLAILFAFYVPAYAYLPLLIGMVSFFAYEPFLFHTEMIPMSWLALALLAGVAVLVRWTLCALYPEAPPPAPATPDIPETDRSA